MHWRTLLFVPGNRPDRFSKAFASATDAVCLDIEDAVSISDKVQARLDVAQALASPWPLPALVRINALGTKWHEEDVRALSALPEDVQLMLPKANLQAIQTLAGHTNSRGLVALIESTTAIEEAYAIARQPTVTALMLGGADLIAELGGQFSWEPLLYARSRLLMAAVSARRLAIDVPCLNLKDAAIIEDESRRVKALGYSCKAAIHPAQIAPIHKALTPSKEEVARAQAMLAAFRASAGDAIEWQGLMLDEAIIAAAERTLLLADKNKPTNQES